MRFFVSLNEMRIEERSFILTNMDALPFEYPITNISNTGQQGYYTFSACDHAIVLDSKTEHIISGSGSVGVQAAQIDRYCAERGIGIADRWNSDRQLQFWTSSDMNSRSMLIGKTPVLRYVPNI